LTITGIRDSLESPSDPKSHTSGASRPQTSKIEMIFQIVHQDHQVRLIIMKKSQEFLVTWRDQLPAMESELWLPGSGNHRISSPCRGFGKEKGRIFVGRSRGHGFLDADLF
jgi:hypothetical protein